MKVSELVKKLDGANSDAFVQIAGDDESLYPYDVILLGDKTVIIAAESGPEARRRWDEIHLSEK